MKREKRKHKMLPPPPRKRKKETSISLVNKQKIECIYSSILDLMLHFCLIWLLIFLSSHSFSFSIAHYVSLIAYLVSLSSEFELYLARKKAPSRKEANFLNASAAALRTDL